MAKEGSSNKVAIESRNGLARVDVTKLHERGFILRFDDDRLSQVVLRGEDG